jgi:endonuclease III
MNIIPKSKLVKAHEPLIRLGRDYCKRTNPLCSRCPVEILCAKLA